MYDQLTAIYNRYRVYTCDVKITVMNMSTTVPCHVCLYADNVTASQSSSYTANEMQFSTYQPLGTVYSRQGVVQIQKRFNIASILGYLENVDEDLSAVYNANPVQVAFGHLSIEPVSGAALSSYVMVEMEFYAQFFDLKTIGDSLTV